MHLSSRFALGLLTTALLILSIYSAPAPQHQLQNGTLSHNDADVPSRPEALLPVLPELHGSDTQNLLHRRRRIPNKIEQWPPLRSFKLEQADNIPGLCERTPENVLQAILERKGGTMWNNLQGVSDETGKTGSTYKYGVGNTGTKPLRTIKLVARDQGPHGTFYRARILDKDKGDKPGAVTLREVAAPWANKAITGARVQRSLYASIKPLQYPKATSQLEGEKKLKEEEKKAAKDNVVNVMFDPVIEQNSDSAFVMTLNMARENLQTRREDLYKKGQDAINRAILQVANVLVEMHSKGMMHRNIRPESILMDGDTSQLAGFDDAIDQRTSTEFALSGIKDLLSPEKAGSDDRRLVDWIYMTPEMLIQEEYEQTVDVWGLAIVMMGLSRREFWSESKALSFWKSLCDGASTDKYKTPLEVSKLLDDNPDIGTDKKEMTREENWLYSWALCGPDIRSGMEEFRDDLIRLMDPDECHETTHPADEQEFLRQMKMEEHN